MKFAAFLCMLLALCCRNIWLVQGAPGGYRFLAAKCEQYADSAQQLDGPLNLCTFPPKYSGITQQDIDAVVKHIQTLDLS